MTGKTRVVGGVSQYHPTGTTTDDPGISDDSGRRNCGHSARPGRRAHWSKGGTNAGSACTINAVIARGAEGTAWMVFFNHNALSVAVQWEPDGGRYLAQRNHWYRFISRARGRRWNEMSLCCHTKRSRIRLHSKRYCGSTGTLKKITISLPTRKAKELRELHQNRQERRGGGVHVGKKRRKLGGGRRNSWKTLKGGDGA